MAETPRIGKLSKFVALCGLLTIIGSTYSMFRDHDHIVELNGTVAELRQERAELRIDLDSTIAELVATQEELEATKAAADRLASQPGDPARCGNADPRWCSVVGDA